MRSVLLIVSAHSFIAAAQPQPRPLTLADAVDLALRADPSVAEAHIAQDRSKLAVLRAQLDRVSVSADGTLRELWNKSNIAGPTVWSCSFGGITFNADPQTCTGMGGTSSPAPDSQQSPSGWQGNSNLAVTVNVPLFSGFRVSSNVKLRQVQEESSLVTIRQARRDTALAVARAYWAVRRIALSHDALLAAVARLKESEAVAQARVDAGLAPPIDRNRARVRRLQQEAQIADLDGQAHEQSAQLAALLGIAEDIVLVDPPDAPGGGPPSLDELIERAARARPEIARARLAYAAQEQVVRIARSDYFPQLSALGLFQYGNNQFNPSSGASAFSTAANPLAGLSGNVQVGALLKMNLFNMFTTYTNVGDARYELARLGEELRLARRTVEIDVRVARARLDHLYAQRAPLLAALDVARDNEAIVRARYQNGEALVIELFDAQVDLATTERQLADLSAQLHLAWLELDAALGSTVGVP